MRNTEREAGNATVRALGLMVALVLIAGMLLSALQVLNVRERAQAGIDLAALAGASAVIESVGASAQGDPCERASSVASANGLVLQDCVVQGLDVVASASARVPALGLTFDVHARAGPWPGTVADGLVGAVASEKPQ